MQRMNCRVVCDERTVQPSAITRAQLARGGGWRRGVGRDPRATTARQPSTLPIRHLTDEDLTTSSALIQAVKLA
jgi:hypothetical protein